MGHAAASIASAIFSAVIKVGKFVSARGTTGNSDASTTREKPSRSFSCYARTAKAKRATDHRVRNVGFLEKWDYGKGVGVQEKWRNNPMHGEMT
jgi:hypothetical protein